jgi:Ankyrin repeats (3 copies)
MYMNRSLSSSKDRVSGRHLSKSKSFDECFSDHNPPRGLLTSRSLKPVSSHIKICDLFGGLSLLNHSVHSTSGIRFLDASTHRSLESFRNSIRSSYHSNSSCGTRSFDEDTTYSESDDSSSISSDDSSFAQDISEEVVLVDDVKSNGFCFSLEEIKAMRQSNVLTEIATSPHKEREVLSISEISSKHPKETYKQILIEETGAFTQESYRALPNDFFVRGDEKAHTIKLMTAVRQGDLKTIRQMHKRGLNLQCCNRFKETIVHTAARRGQYEVLEYLSKKAGVSLRVCCDTGRTPLHDAAWSTTPNFRSVTLLLQDCPDLLGVSDSRQFVPLDYVPRSAYSAWNQFLIQNRALLIPKGLPLN